MQIESAFGHKQQSALPKAPCIPDWSGHREGCLPGIRSRFPLPPTHHPAPRSPHPQHRRSSSRSPDVRWHLRQYRQTVSPVPGDGGTLQEKYIFPERASYCHRTRAPVAHGLPAAPEVFPDTPRRSGSQAVSPAVPVWTEHPAVLPAGTVAGEFPPLLPRYTPAVSVLSLSPAGQVPDILPPTHKGPSSFFCRLEALKVPPPEIHTGAACRSPTGHTVSSVFQLHLRLLHLKFHQLSSLSHLHGLNGIMRIFCDLIQLCLFKQ